jgi:uncharacterized protein (DUF488 family)
VLVFTVGHSTRTLEELVTVLRAWGIETLVDVRTVPRSRTNPQFNADTLPAALEAAGIAYVHMAGLGGLRGKKKGSTPSRNDGWENDSFRNYADYTQTPPFARAFEELLALAERSTCAVMCAEAVWWRCHRRIIADHLLARGVQVRHIFDAEKADDATPTPFLRRDENGSIFYPAADESPVERR